MKPCHFVHSFLLTKLPLFAKSIQNFAIFLRFPFPQTLFSPIQKPYSFHYFFFFSFKQHSSPFSIQNSAPLFFSLRLSSFFFCFLFRKLFSLLSPEKDLSSNPSKKKIFAVGFCLFHPSEIDPETCGHSFSSCLHTLSVQPIPLALSHSWKKPGPKRRKNWFSEELLLFEETGKRCSIKNSSLRSFSPLSFPAPTPNSTNNSFGQVYLFLDSFLSPQLVWSQRIPCFCTFSLFTF